MQNLENIFQRIDNEFRDLKQAENSNVDEIRKVLNRQAEALRARTASPLLPTPLPAGFEPAQAAAVVDLCHVLLNLNEFLYVD